MDDVISLCSEVGEISRRRSVCDRVADPVPGCVEGVRVYWFPGIFRERGGNVESARELIEARNATCVISRWENGDVGGGLIGL